MLKLIQLFSLAFAFVMASGFRTVPETISEAERKAAIDYMNETKERLIKDVQGLTEEQLNFKATPTSWSVAECLEHIAFSEGALFGVLQGTLKEAANPSRRSEVKMTDEQVKGMISSRERKVKTQEMFEPKKQFGSAEGSLKEFVAKRNSNMEFAKTTQEDLRNHYAVMPFATFDSYQMLLFITGHSARHTSQIEEVMAHADFPKKK
jgi:uncharacterized damage-inducible protein DinB